MLIAEFFGSVLFGITVMLTLKWLGFLLLGAFGIAFVVWLIRGGV